MVAVGAVQEGERRVLVDDAKAERAGEEAERSLDVARVEIDVDDLARPVGPIGGIGMIGAAADESEIAAVGILAGKAVAAAGGRERRGLCRLAARGGGPAVQRVDRVAVGDVEHVRITAGRAPACRPTMW
jgi:hypothetical protein